MVSKTASDEADTIGWAVCYCTAAAKLAYGGIGRLIIPFYSLIGGSIENGLKAVLEHRRVEPKKSGFIRTIWNNFGVW